MYYKLLSFPEECEFPLLVLDIQICFSFVVIITISVCHPKLNSAPVEINGEIA